MRSLFTKKSSPKPPLRQLIDQRGGGGSSASIASMNDDPNGPLAKILALPLPKLIADAEFDHMDIFTAASLNSESIQRYIGPIGPSTSTSSEQNAPAFDKAAVELVINSANVHNWTPLMYAAYLGHKEMLQVLLQRGINAEARNDSGQTSLMMAASCGSVDVVNILVRYGAKINEQDKFGRSPLHYAVKYNQAKITSILLEKGADPNLNDSDEMTPTLMACEVGNEATVSALLRYKGDPDRRNKRAENGLLLATAHPKILTVLQQQKQQQQQHEFKAINKNGDNRANDSLPTCGANDTNNFDSVALLLTELNLGKYANNFREHKVLQLIDFLSLTNEKLDEMGITLFGPKKKILDAIQQYRQFGAFHFPLNEETEALKLSECQDDSQESISTRNVEKNLVELERELQHYDQLCSTQNRILHENQMLNAQIHSLLRQILASGTENWNMLTNNISATLKRIEEMNSKLSSMLDIS